MLFRSVRYFLVLRIFINRMRLIGDPIWENINISTVTDVHITTDSTIILRDVKKCSVAFLGQSLSPFLDHSFDQAVISDSSFGFFAVDFNNLSYLLEWIIK